MPTTEEKIAGLSPEQKVEFQKQFQERSVEKFGSVQAGKQVARKRLEDQRAQLQQRRNELQTPDATVAPESQTLEEPVEQPEIVPEVAETPEVAPQVAEPTGTRQDVPDRVEDGEIVSGDIFKVGSAPIPTRPEPTPEPVVVSGINTANDLSIAVQNATILPGSPEFEAVAQSSPQIVAEYEANRRRNQEIQSINAVGQVLSGKQVERQPKASDQILSFLTQSLDTDLTERYKNEVLNNPELEIAYKDLDSLNTDINKIDDALDALGDDLRSQFKG